MIVWCVTSAKYLFDKWHNEHNIYEHKKSFDKKTLFKSDSYSLKLDYIIIWFYFLDF